jgi:predicted Zn-dependent protease
MPYTHNGIGTWYYGKGRIHRRKGTCSYCNRVGELESYDTTLYFVVLFLPIIPMGSKRVLEACPHCRKHRALSLKKWEAIKAQDIARLLEQLEKDPDDRNNVMAAIGLAVSYQDEGLFDKLAGTLASHRRDDAAIQSQLGAAFGYFSRHPEAEAAYRASLAVEDNPSVRQQLALALLKQDRPEDSVPYLQHVLDNKTQESAGLIFLIVEAYQAKGMHQEALAVMDQRAIAFPELEQSKDIQKQRKTSLRYLDSGKKVRSAYLSESGKVGYQEGSWKAKVPRLVAPLLLAGILCWYLGTAIWLGYARKVHFVNGTSAPYTVSINGESRDLLPGVATAIRVPEGEITTDLNAPGLPVETIECHIETPFFSRPFANHTFVINPDRAAVIMWEEVEYAAKPPPGTPPTRFHLGKVLHAFEGIDYEFTPFPETVPLEKGHSVKKTGISLLANLNSEARISVAERTLSPNEQIDYGKRLATLTPRDEISLYWVVSKLPDADALEFLKARLADRPLLVEWHRAYQHIMDRAHPEQNLVPEYKKNAAENSQNPDAIYLLARISDHDMDESDRLLRQAADASPPSAYALHALAYNALIQARFSEAVAWSEKAMRLAPYNVVINTGYREALSAAGKYDELISLLREDQNVPGRKVTALMGIVGAYAAKKDWAKADSVIEETMKTLQGRQVGGAQTLRAVLKSVICCAKKDVPGYLAACPQDSPAAPFMAALMRKNLKEAGELAARGGDSAINQHALVYIAANKAGNKELAKAEWSRLLEVLKKSGARNRRVAELLSADKSFNADTFCRLPSEISQKRVLLVVAALRYPGEKKKFLELARKLDFSPDAASLCLHQYLD